MLLASALERGGSAPLLQSPGNFLPQLAPLYFLWIESHGPLISQLRPVSFLFHPILETTGSLLPS